MSIPLHERPQWNLLPASTSQQVRLIRKSYEKGREWCSFSQPRSQTLTKSASQNRTQLQAMSPSFHLYNDVYKHFGYDGPSRAMACIYLVGTPQTLSYLTGRMVQL